jgi:hypothetical protein
MNITRFEKRLEEIRAVVAGLEELEVSDDMKMARNYLLIWASELEKICSCAVLDSGEGMSLGDRFRRRLFLKTKFPTFEKNVKDFFIQVCSFMAEISSQEE